MKAIVNTLNDILNNPSLNLSNIVTTQRQYENSNNHITNCVQQIGYYIFRQRSVIMRAIRRTCNNDLAAGRNMRRKRY